MLYLVLFFESVCFPTIVALGIRGLGRHYKRGSGFIVGGVCGGAVVPPILGHVADMRNDTGFAFIVPTMVSFLSPFPPSPPLLPHPSSIPPCMNFHGNRSPSNPSPPLSPRNLDKYRNQSQKFLQQSHSIAVNLKYGQPNTNDALFCNP